MGLRTLFTISFLLLAAIAAYPSGPGSLDLSFAGTGYKYEGFGRGADIAQKTAVQPDGKIVVVGYTSIGPITTSFKIALARYNSDGTFDTTFSGDGKHVVPTLSGPEEGRSVAIQPDGKIVVAGYAYNGVRNDFLIMRFNSDGTPDTTFDGDGRVATISPGTDSKVYDVAIQADGRIVAAGMADGAVWGLRYNSDGSLDATFDGDGIAEIPTTTFNGVITSMVVQDGRIVIAGAANGDFALIRFNTDGSLDTSFDSDGIVTTPILNLDWASSIALQPDGKIVAAGTADFDFGAVRYNTDGSLDTSFDGDGKITISFTNTGVDWARSVAVRPNGGIVLAGSAEPTGGIGDFAVAVYNADGSLDTSFDGDGKLTMSFGASIDRAYSTVVQADGKIIVGGQSRDPNRSDDFALVRFNTNGLFDTSFDNDGLLTSDIGDGGGAGRAVIVQPDGKIVVLAAASQFGDAYDSHYLVRYNQDGSPDTSFGVGGRSLQYPGAARVVEVLLQADGKILVVSSSGPFPGQSIAVVRYHPNGSLDTTFGTNGIVTTSIPGNSDSIGAAGAIQPDGKIVVLGYGYIFPSVDSHPAMVRYNPNGSLDTSFDGDGVVTTPGLPGMNLGSVAIQPDGKIVAGGSNRTGTSPENFTLSRYNSDGSLDATFDGDGIVTTTPLAGGGSYVSSLELLPDGWIVAGGRASDGSNSFFALARYNMDGSLDPSFDSDGIAVTQVLAQDSLRQIKVQSDGKIVSAGESWGGSNYDMALIRHNFDGSLDLSYGTDGKAFIDLGSTEYCYGLALDAGDRAVVACRGSSVALTARVQSGFASQPVDVGGRVTSTNGQGISGATVVLRDASNNRRNAITNAFGYFVFSAVSTLESYVVNVSSKRYRFQPSSQTITVTGSVSNIDFVGNSGSESKIVVKGGEGTTAELTDIQKP